jgi:hypothetical protein
MQIDPKLNPYQAPNPEPRKTKKPFLKPLIEKTKRAALMGTMLSMPNVTVAATSAECQDGKPTTISNFAEHFIDWTVKIAPLGYGVAFMTVFAGDNKKAKNKPED